MRIKQLLANWLLRGAQVKRGKDIGGQVINYTIVAPGWSLEIRAPYTPGYAFRTIAEHAAIQKRIQHDPKTCEHLKGGRWAPRSIFKDYNLSRFTFVDGSTQIKCLNCKTVWTPESPDWKEAVRMMDRSTNTPNACEQPIRIVKIKDAVSG
jgi:hypothetical protein